MPSSSPQPGDLHVDVLLSGLSVQMMNEPSNYVADRVFPIIPVRKQTNQYPIFDKFDFFRSTAMLRAPGEETMGSGYKVSFDSYRAENYGTHVEVDDETRANADDPFDPDREATELVVDRLKLLREVNWVADFFATAKWTAEVAGTTDFTKWNDWAGSDPLLDFDVARDAQYKLTAKNLDQAAIGRLVWTQGLKHHPDFIEKIKFTQKAVLTLDLVASMLDLKRLMLVQALQTTSAEGAATETMDYIAGNHCLFFWNPDRPGARTPAAGYTFHWNNFGGISFIRRMRRELNMTDRIEGHTYFDQKQVTDDLGYFFLNAI